MQGDSRKSGRKQKVDFAPPGCLEDPDQRLQPSFVWGDLNRRLKNSFKILPRFSFHFWIACGTNLPRRGWVRVVPDRGTRRKIFDNNCF